MRRPTEACAASHEPATRGWSPSYERTHQLEVSPLPPEKGGGLVGSLSPPCKSGHMGGPGIAIGREGLCGVGTLGLGSNHQS